MAKIRTLLFSIFFALLGFGLSPSALAQTGSSIPYFEVDTLYIPRIDVEGFGSLQLSLKLDDPVALTFSIFEAVTAAPGLTPGATFDLDTLILDVPLAHADFEFFSLQLQLAPDDLFQLTVADTTELEGQSDYNALCADCHGTDGQGGIVSVSLVNCAICEDSEGLVSYISNLMPLGNTETCVGSCAQETGDFILNVFQIDDSPIVAQALEALDEMPLDQTLEKAALQLVSRLPTSAEMSLVANSGESGLRSALDGMMEEDAFYDRLEEIFNDLIHTNRYLTRNGSRAEALNLMRVFPDAFWFDPGDDNRDLETLQLLEITNDSVAREPLELVKHVVRNNLPATEILTADYFMVNGYSAKSYGVFDSLSFNDEWDETEWRQAQIDGIPHAGMLTSLMFLNRYPTSDTNRNRGRSRVVYDLFLDVDILALEGTRPDGEAVDISSPAPTLDNDDCVVCHGLLDPVASSFENWNDRGFYVPNRPWYTDMFQAGFAGIDRPDSEEPTSLQWLASEMEDDLRFDDAMVRILYNGLTGQEPLDPPGETATEAESDAYSAESVHLDELKAVYVADNQNLKTLVKEIVLSPYFRADGLKDESFAIVHEETGAARLLSPDMLHRKINALLGFEWRSPLDFYSETVNIDTQAKLLDNSQFYHQIYGGIDSFVVTERLTEPNGLMVAVQERMANELACYAVPEDFLRANNDRLLFPFVDQTTQPTSSQNQADIRANIQHLHAHLLGEVLNENDSEIDMTYQLFVDVLEAGQNSIGSTEQSALPIICRRTEDIITGEELSVELGDDPQYVVRAWMAVLGYLLSDYRFVYE